MTDKTSDKQSGTTNSAAPKAAATKRAPAKKAGASKTSAKRTAAVKKTTAKPKATAKSTVKKTSAKPAVKKPAVKKTTAKKTSAASAKSQTTKAAATKASADSVQLKAAASEHAAPANKLQELINSGVLSKETIASAADMMKKTALNPELFSKHQVNLLNQLAEVASGKSEIAPARSDKRFKDETWDTNPLYKSMMQGYLALGDSMNQWLNDSGIETRQMERSRIVLSNMMDALSPTNTLWGNPAAIKKAFDTSGMSLVDGMRNFVSDLVNNNGMPTQVDKTPFKLGENVACTPGKVVFRTDMLELIHYAPQTDKVHARPLFLVPPQINKFYVFDMAKNRSMIEYLVQQGFQVFAVSWYNPGTEQGGWGFENYVLELANAVDVCCDISGSDDVNVFGACSGGITATTLNAYLSAKGSKKIYSQTLPVAVLDTGKTGDTALGLFANRQLLELAMLLSSQKGILEGTELAKVFTWMRPNDLVWNYWINNYLLGNTPLPFDVLFWNSDTTNLPAKLHHDYIALMQNNPLTKSGELVIDGQPIDLKNVTSDLYIVGATTDHITPWEACLRQHRTVRRQHRVRAE